MGQTEVSRTCTYCGTLNAAGEQNCITCSQPLASGNTQTILANNTPAVTGFPLAPTVANSVIPLTAAGSSIPTKTMASSSAPSVNSANMPPAVVGAAIPPAIAAPVSGPQAHLTGRLGAGEVLDGGRYRIVQLLGWGNFGAVYKAVDRRLNDFVVAIKEMSDAHLTRPEREQAFQNFHREANLLVHLKQDRKHPNLPDVSNFFEEGGKAYLVMEFVDGDTLAKRQDDAAGPLDEALVLEWALQLCDVLDFLHTQPQPIIFRDLKPANVMITTKKGQIKLIDFGIARIFKQTARSDTELLGTPGYAPLEQYGQDQTDGRSDIYALGATLYSLLTKTPPANAMKRTLNPASFQRPRQLNPLISSATERILLRAMEMKPTNRYQFVTEMSQEIQSNRQAPGSPASNWQAPPVQPTPGQQQPGPQSQKTSRRGFIIGGLVTAAALATGGSIWYFIENRHSSTNNNPGLGGVIPVTFAYSTEKKDWLTAAIGNFHNSNAANLNGKNIQISLLDSGSLDVQASILKGDIQPTVWSPASSLEVNRLNSLAGKEMVITNADDLQSLVLSPLVFAVWQSRATVLLKHYNNSIDWPSIADAVQRKWADIGGQSNWQYVKFGQTRPDQSNSGLLTITLMAYAFLKEHNGLTVDQLNDPAFLAPFKVIEGSVTAFGHSSGTFLEKVVLLLGPSAYDIVTTYENLVLTHQKDTAKLGDSLLMFYPGLDIVSDHPFGILKGSWVTSEQQEAARAFRRFLLDAPQQRLALQYGLRPANTNVSVNDAVANNLFHLPGTGVKHDFPQSVQLPTIDVVSALIALWQKNYNGTPTANG